MSDDPKRSELSVGVDGVLVMVRLVQRDLDAGLGTMVELALGHVEARDLSDAVLEAAEKAAAGCDDPDCPFREEEKPIGAGEGG